MTDSGTDTKNRRELIWNLYQRSLLRANQANPPWPPEREQEAMDVWIAALEPIKEKDLPRLFHFAHVSRERRLFGKPLTPDDLLYVWNKLKRGMTWNFCSDQWEHPNSSFYAPPTNDA